MNLGERSAASSNNPFGTDADIVAYLEAMHLREASSSRQRQAPPLLQQRYATPTSPLEQPAPSQTLWTTIPPGVNSLAHQLQVARQFWQQPQQQLRNPWDESSSSGGYGSNIGAASYNRQHISVSHPSEGTLSASARHYSPMAPSRPPVAQQPCTLSASASKYQLVAASCIPVASPPWTASSSTSQQYRPFGSPYYQHGDESCLLRALPGIQAGLSPLLAPTAIRRDRTMEGIRWELLRGPMDPQVVLFPETSAHVVCLLGEGGEEIRRNVLAGVKSNMHKVMDSREGHKVFVALLHCCEGRFHELEGIVQAAVARGPNARGSLLRSAKQDHGETSIKELIRAVAQYPKLCKMIIDCFLGEQIIDHSRGEQLLHHCFTTMRYEDTLILIHYAITNNDLMLSSSFGSRCLAECFANASGDELHILEHLLLSKANDIARGQYSNYFVQRVLECGSMETKQRIVEILMADVVSLSQHQFGSYVVEACFLKSGLPAMSTSMHRMLTAFQRLCDDQLGELVQGGFSNYVVHKLLETGKDHFLQQTVALARRIERLPPHTLEEMHARQVLRVIKRLFPRHRIY